MKNVRPYKARNGAQQYMPSIALLERLGYEGYGFCLACSAEVPNVEPDGAEELALMGLCY